MTLRNRISEIAGYMPSVDPRNAAETYVLDGKNFYFDSFGPVSGFPAEQLTPFKLSAPNDVQGIRVLNTTLVFTGDSIRSWRETQPYTWDVLYLFLTPTRDENRIPWRATYLNNKLFVAHTQHGLFTSTITATNPNIRLAQQTSATIPGLIPNVAAVDVVRGRLILVNNLTIQWGAVGNVTSLAPALGGAGFQAISNFARGTFLALTAFQDSFIVWTTEGAILVQYIGGDEVWRFDPLISREWPVSPWATCTLSDGRVLILSRHGLMITQNGNIPEAITPQFNEFFLAQFKDSTAFDRRWRIEYDFDRQLVFIMESSDGLTYYQSYVLSLTLDKWGIFSQRVTGILPLTQDSAGYVTPDGTVYRFAAHYGIKKEPSISACLNRVAARNQKTLEIPSSSAVLYVHAAPEVVGDGRFIAGDQPNAVADAWYEPTSFYPKAIALSPLDSFIDIGYTVTDDRYADAGRIYNAGADLMIDTTSILVGSLKSSAPLNQPFATDYRLDYFFPTLEDWLTDVGAEDWNLGADSTEEWHGIPSSFPQLSYGISLQTSMDGITFDANEVVMAKFGLGATLFTVQASGHQHVMRFTANKVNEYFRIQYLELTHAAGGRYA